MAAENYHLKWDSHLSYLNSSVATLYKNEKFADVVLYSSSSIGSNGNGVDGGGIPTVGISAHKFILSSCSQFFATMFETAPISAPNGVLYVVLPPDLSHRAIQILVQYMYSGEATVANDILSEVLRGGEILKIRGLCRTSSTTHHHPNQREPSAGSNSSHYGTNGARPLPLTQLPGGSHANDIYTLAANSNKCPSNNSNRYGMEQSQHQQLQHQQFRGLGASVMLKDSPVIVKSPKLQQIGLLPSSGTKNHAGSGISVNKEVAIDPEDKCCYQLSQQHESMPVGQSSLCGEVGCSSCPMLAETEQLRCRHSRSHGDELGSNTLVPQHVEQCIAQEYEERPQPPGEHCEHEDGGIRYERRIRRRSERGERVRDFFISEPYDPPSTTNSKQYTDPVVSRHPPPPPPSPPLHPHNFLAIKQEPTDWSTPGASENNSNENMSTIQPISPIRSPKLPLDFKLPLGGAAVKLETGSAHSADEEEPSGSSGEYDSFTRLVCEICKKTFDDPKTWVQHLETHAANNELSTAETTSNNVATTSNGGDILAKSYVPKKRRRVSQQENSMDHVTLLCDLCSTSFKTPAEWVRHMNNQHTEIELAMFNSKKDNEQKTCVSLHRRN